MAFLLPRGWWHQVLDGFIYEVDVGQALAFHGGLTAVRGAAYREASKRQVGVGASKVSTNVILIQAHRESHRGILHDSIATRPAPTTRIEEYEKLRLSCQCNWQGEPHHRVFCQWWRIYPEPGPLWPKAPNAYEQGLVAACTCGLGNDTSTGHPPTCAVWG